MGRSKGEPHSKFESLKIHSLKSLALSQPDWQFSFFFTSCVSHRMKYISIAPLIQEILYLSSSDSSKGFVLF